MTCSRAGSLAATLVIAATLSACNGSSNPTGPSLLEDTPTATATSSGTVKAQNAPAGVFKTIPHADELGRIIGGAPLTVTFNMCASTDADAGDALTYTYSFGDGSTASRLCRADHTFARQGTFEATVCVADKRLSDRSEVCTTYQVKVSGESTPAKQTTVSGSVTLCDEFSKGTAFNGDMCGTPSDQKTRHFFDFDSLQKVPVSSGAADFGKGQFYFDRTGASRPNPGWYTYNGTVQVDTGIGASQIGSVTCSATDGRTYSPSVIADYLPTVNVICLRTAGGRYVKYTARTPVPSGNSGIGFYATDLTIDYTTN